jgi:hypothetical protein
VEWGRILQEEEERKKKGKRKRKEEADNFSGNRGNKWF